MNEPDREALLGRIQALLNKTVERGATEAEAQAALAVAQRLMDAHNIELAQVVDHDSDAVAMGQEVAWEGKSANSLYDAVMPIIAEVFAVRAHPLRREAAARVGRVGHAAADDEGRDPPDRRPDQSGRRPVGARLPGRDLPPALGRLSGPGRG
jgi:hypothetical protein